MHIIGIVIVGLILISIVAVMVLRALSQDGYTIVLLQNGDDKPTLSTMKSALKAAWGTDPADDPAQPVAITSVKFDDEKTPTSDFMVKYHDLGWGLSYVSSSWFDRMTDKQRQEEEPALRKVSELNKGYWEISILQPAGKPSPDTEKATAQLIKQLANENTLAVMSESYGTFNPMTEQVKEKLHGNEPSLVFTSQIYAPMSKISPDEAAKFQRQAKDTFDEFVSAFGRKADADRNFSVKFRLQDSHGTEHIWGKVTGIEDGNITCEIANEPQLATSYKMGQVVTIKDRDLEDWTYMHNDQVMGGYSAPRDGR